MRDLIQYFDSAPAYIFVIGLLVSLAGFWLIHRAADFLEKKYFDIPVFFRFIFVYFIIVFTCAGAVSAIELGKFITISVINAVFH